MASPSLLASGDPATRSSDCWPLSGSPDYSAKQQVPCVPVRGIRCNEANPTRCRSTVCQGSRTMAMCGCPNRIYCQRVKLGEFSSCSFVAAPNDCIARCEKLGAASHAPTPTQPSRSLSIPRDIPVPF
jgi:hypothetical protein